MSLLDIHARRRFPLYHLAGSAVVLVSVILAGLVVAGIFSWSSSPHPVLAKQELAGVPRERTGLIPNSDNRGQVLFGRYCDSCHTGGRGMIGPSLSTAEFKSHASLESITQLVRKGGFDMPSFPIALLSDADLQQIAEFVMKLPEEGH